MSRSFLRRLMPSLVSAIAMTATADDKTAPVSFTRDVAPVLAVHCQGCHHEKKASMGFDLSSFARMKNGGKQAGPDEMIVPGKPDESRLAEVIQADAEPRMPFKLRPLPDSAIETIVRWIAEGAKYDAPDADTPLIALIDPASALKAQAAIGNAASDPKARGTAVARSVSLSSDGKLVAVDRGHHVDLYDTNVVGEPTKSFGPFQGVVSALAFDKKGESLFVAHGRPGIDGNAARVEISSGKIAYDTRAHDDQILALAISPDQATMATASYDRTIGLIDSESGKKRASLAEHTDAVYDVAFSPADSNLLASASGDRSVKTWDVRESKRLETLSEATAELYAVTFSSDGRTVYAGGVDRTLRAWSLAAKPPRLIRSSLAHDAPITRLIVRPAKTADQAELLSISEDKTLRRWTPGELRQIGSLRKFDDWATALSATSDRLAVSDHSGAAWLLDLASIDGKPLWIKTARSTRAGAPDALKPELVRQADLGRPSPQFVSAGSKTTLTLSGQGVGRATQVWITPGDVKGTLVPHGPPQPNSIKLELEIPWRDDFSTVSLKLATPLGITGTQIVGVSPVPIVNLDARSAGDTTPPSEFPAGSAVRTVINAPSRVFQARVPMRKGVPLSIRAQGKAFGSSLNERIRLLSNDGRTLAAATAIEGRDTLLSYLPEADGVSLLEVSDLQFSGGGNHFVLLSLSDRPVADSVWPPAYSRIEAAEFRWNSRTGQMAATSIPAKPGSQVDQPQVEPVSLPDRWLADRTLSVLSVGGRVVPASADAPILAPGDAGIGRFRNSDQTDTFRFEARAGQPLVVETYARRLGGDVDTIIEITNDKGQPVVAARFRKVADTLVDFRDHTSRQKGIRLTRWPEFRMNDYVLIGREITRIFQLPKNPDDDCQFYGDEARWGYFGTTPEQVPMGRTVTRLEPIPRDEAASVDPGVLHEVHYVNDDGGFTVGNDSCLIFEPPADGVYRVHVRETQGRVGDNAAYAVALRTPQPDFRVQLNMMDWNIPRGGSRLLTATIRRMDGFEGPVSLTIEGLPAHFRATSGVIEAGQLSADLLVETIGELMDEIESQATWKLVARAEVDGKELTHTIDGTGSRWAITPPSNLRMTTSADRVRLVPGQVAELKLKVDRAEAFKGRVPVDVRNLPYGVRVLDIGLNGVMITEKETERVIRIFAEEWVSAQSRPFFAVGRAEAAGTGDSAPPVMLEIVPQKSTQVTASSGSAR